MSEILLGHKMAKHMSVPAAYWQKCLGLRPSWPAWAKTHKLGVYGKNGGWTEQVGQGKAFAQLMKTLKWLARRSGRKFCRGERDLGYQQVT